jgi:hypothetical protein
MCVSERSQEALDNIATINKEESRLLLLTLVEPMFRHAPAPDLINSFSKHPPYSNCVCTQQTLAYPVAPPAGTHSCVKHLYKIHKEKKGNYSEMFYSFKKKSYTEKLICDGIRKYFNFVWEGIELEDLIEVLFFIRNPQQRLQGELINEVAPTCS